MFVTNKKNSRSTQLLQTVEHKMSYISEKNHYQHKLKIQRKLNNLYNGTILFPNNDDKFLNLSDHVNTTTGGSPQLESHLLSF